MDDSNYLKILKESVSPTHLQEAVPWRVGTVPLEKGRTSIDGLSQECLVLNELSFIMKLNPSFMLVVPKMKLLYKDGGGTNGYIITARKAQQLEYQTIQKGSCLAKAYFFGRPKPGRTLDIYQRIFEQGFSIENIKGISGFPPGARIDITASGKDFAGTSFFTGAQGGDERQKDMFKIPARFKTVV